MPSRLGTLGRRYLDSNSIGTKTALRGEQAQPIPIGPPFGGYTPDLVAPVAGLASATYCTGLISKGGDLQQDDGFAKVDSARLPLGASTLPSGTPQAITGLFSSFDVSGTPGPMRLAMTCKGSDTTGRLYELQNSNGQWAHRAAQGANTFGGTTTAATLFDYTYFPPAQSAAVTTGCAVLTNNVDQIMRYPSSAATTTYDLFDSSASYIAKSVEVSEDRVLALNVNVAGTRYTTRLIWTNKGATPSFNTANVGAGFSDFLDVKGQGLKVMNLGQLVALYFDSAVVVLQRTGIATDPFRRLYTSNERGLLSTQSVVQLGSGVHFGIFTDGWFFFDDQARWEEIGITQVSGVNLHKWHKTFYELLDWENKSRVTCVYDGVNRFIRIAFPTKGNTNPDMVWNYDLLTDSIWPDVNYGALAPNCWGSWYDIAQTGTTWDSFSGSQTFDSPPLNAWDSYAGTRGRYRVQHGTTSGLVFKHDPQLVTRDGATGTYSYSSNQVPVGSNGLQKTSKRLVISYTRQVNSSGGNPPPITGTLSADSGQSSSRTFQQTKGALGTNQSEIIAAQVSGTNMGWAVSGSHPIKITGAEIHITGRGQMNATDD